MKLLSIFNYVLLNTTRRCDRIIEYRISRHMQNNNWRCTALEDNV